MKLSAPIYQLKRRAKALSNARSIPLHKALERIAKDEGFNSWSLLAAKASQRGPCKEIFARLEQGDLLLLGARPGHGKTTMSAELLIEGIKAGHQGVFFTLEYSETDVVSLFESLGQRTEEFSERLTIDNSDSINAQYIIRQLSDAAVGTVVTIDYLQLLDQKRDNPPLSDQVRDLKLFANERGLIIVFISQIDRSYDPSNNAFPGLSDVRLPNPVDLRLFNKACFLNDGEVQMTAFA